MCVCVCVCVCECLLYWRTGMQLCVCVCVCVCWLFESRACVIVKPLCTFLGRKWTSSSVRDSLGRNFGALGGDDK